jgi:hypothetical protein
VDRLTSPYDLIFHRGLLPVEEFTVGTKVRVAFPAYTVSDGGVYFGREVEGVVIDGQYGDNINVSVDNFFENGLSKSQLVAPKYLTKIQEEVTPEFKLGDKVKIVSSCDGYHGLRIGETATIERLPQTDSDSYRLRREESRLYQYVPVDGFEALSTKETEIKVGDVVKIVNDGNDFGLRHYFEIGSIVTVERVAPYVGGSYTLRGKVVWEDETAETDTQSVKRESFEPFTAPEQDKALTAALARAEAAEKALEAFKDKVRTAVIEEAEEQGWCGEVDRWLGDLGLATRWPSDFPRNQHAVVKLSGGRIAIRKDDDSEPWRIYHDGADIGGWHSDATVSRQFDGVLHEGDN